MQRLDKILKQFNLPKVCTQRIYDCLCVPRGAAFHKRGSRWANSYEVLPELVYVVHKSSEHWGWVICYEVVGKEHHLHYNKYIKKRIQGRVVPYIEFNCHAFWLNRQKRLPKEVGIIRQ